MPPTFDPRTATDTAGGEGGSVDWRSVSEAYADEEQLRYWTALADAGLLPFERGLIEKWVGTRGRVLVVGCGAGRESLALGKQSIPVTGIDVSLPLVEEAASRARSTGIHHLAADGALLPFRDCAFHGILVFSQALAHIPGRARRRRALQDMARVLHPDGAVLLALNHGTFKDYPVTYLLYRLLGPRRRQGRPPAPSAASIGEGRDRPGRVAEALQLMILARLLRGRLRLRTARYRLFGPPSFAPESPRDLYIHIRKSYASFRPRPGLSYFHLYTRKEFLDDLAESGLAVAAVHSWRELNGDYLPSLLRHLDFKFVYVLRRAR